MAALGSMAWADSFPGGVPLLHVSREDRITVVLLQRPRRSCVERAQQFSGAHRTFGVRRHPDRRYRVASDFPGGERSQHRSARVPSHFIATNRVRGSAAVVGEGTEDTPSVHCVPLSRTKLTQDTRRELGRGQCQRHQQDGEDDGEAAVMIRSQALRMTYGSCRDGNSVVRCAPYAGGVGIGSSTACLED